MPEQQTELDFTAPEPKPRSGQEALDAILTRTYLQYLKSDSWRVRRKGIHGLADADYSPQIAAVLENFTRDKDGRVREAAQIALAKMGARR